ncbi:MAG: F0F1 ATP synthase subunit B [Anaerolineae bacterium]|nr:F0F1 ATP synthase subunit B [Anaerolineae bacterium]
MHKITLKRLAIVGVLALMLVAAASVMAQEATAAPAVPTTSETTTTTAAEATTEAHVAEAPAAAEAAGEEKAGGIEALGLNAGYLFAQIVNFMIIFVALGALLWKPIVNMLDSRSAKIQKGLEDAQVAANARRNAEAEAETIRANARADIAKGVEEGRTRGDEVAKQVEAEARAEAERIRTEARTSAAAERDQQLAGLRGQIAAIALAATNKLIGSAIDESKAKSLIDGFFTDVPSSALKLGGDVEVVSAMPLNDAEQAKAKSSIGAANIKFVVDPNILGGLIVRSGDRVVDGSVRSGLNDLGARLN